MASDSTSTTSTVKIFGYVRSGTEGGCKLLNLYGVDFLLLGGDSAVLRSGARVEVSGRILSGGATTCGEGLPFQVQTAKAY